MQYRGRKGAVNGNGPLGGLSDRHQKRKLKEMVDEQRPSVSEIMRQLINEAHQARLTTWRKWAVEEIAKLQDVPDTETFSR